MWGRGGVPAAAAARPGRSGRRARPGAGRVPGYPAVHIRLRAADALVLSQPAALEVCAASPRLASGQKQTRDRKLSFFFQI